MVAARKGAVWVHIMTDFTSWFVGMEVVYIGPNCEGVTVRRGRIYKILAIDVAGKGSLVMGLDNIVQQLPQDMVFIRVTQDAELWSRADAFRPVVKRQTDISVFHELRRGIERQMDKLKEFERTHPL